MLLKLVKHKQDDFDLGDMIAGVNKLGAVRRELDELAEDVIKRKHRMFIEYLAIGQDLIKARELMRANYSKGDAAGTWLAWLEKVGMSHQMAGKIIWVYEKYKGGAAGGTPILGINFSVHVELANPKADPKAVAEVEKELRQGKKMGRDEVRAKVKSTTQPKSKSKKKKSKKMPTDTHDQPVYPWVDEAKIYLEKGLSLLREHKNEEIPGKDYFVMVASHIMQAAQSLKSK